MSVETTKLAAEWERRCLPISDTDLRLESFEDGRKRIMGYAVVYNSLSQPIPLYGGGTFRERILPGAFARALAEKQDIIACVDHDEGKILGRVAAGNLKLTSTKRGLLMEVVPPDTGYARDTIANIEAGNVNGMSFSFIARTDEWNMEDGEEIRNVLDADIFHVSTVSRPAYQQTTASVRSEFNTDVALRSLDAWRAHQKEEQERIEAEQRAAAELQARLESYRQRAQEVGG